jgi:ABC-type transport system involved in multi-copper enzyme maturation permease subunit
MSNVLRAEFRKILSVRSTYVITAVALLLTAFLSFYVQGFKRYELIIPSKSAESLFLASTIMQHASTLGIFCAFIAVLLMTHEYRYNTIVYTLAASNSRSKVLAAKIISILVVVFFISLIITAISLGLTVLGHSRLWS